MITLYEASSNISIDPIGFSCISSKVLLIFSHKPVYPVMVVKNIQSYGVQMSRKLSFKSKKWKQIFLVTLRQNPPPSLFHHPQCRDKLHIPPVKGKDYENLFQKVCFKSAFLKRVTEECTFCWNVLLLTLSRKPGVATITDFLPLLVTVIIHIYIP